MRCTEVPPWDLVEALIFGIPNYAPAILPFGHFATFLHLATCWRSGKHALCRAHPSGLAWFWGLILITVRSLDLLIANLSLTS